jgi:arabinan endo-1,5-alpha-L-arabinosidase
MFRLLKSFENLLHSSTMTRFVTAVLTSLLVTSATFLPLIARCGHAVPITQAKPIAYAIPVSQSLSPPPIMSGLYRDPEPCHGNCSWTHDPNIVYNNGTYWRFATSGNIAVSTAPFLQGPWTYKGALLQHGTRIHLRDDQDIWERHAII